jgi:hypothetical protein
MQYFWLLFAKEIFYILISLSCFKTLFVVGILMLQKWFDVDVWDSQIEFWCKYLNFFRLGNCFGYFFAILGDFFQIIWSHWLAKQSQWSHSSYFSWQIDENKRIKEKSNLKWREKGVCAVILKTSNDNLNIIYQL